MFEPKIHRLVEQRVCRKDVDMTSEIYKFSVPVRSHILKVTQHTQFSDGCTGGCPWCSFDVKRKITNGFSWESQDKFFAENGKLMPDEIALYWASDPLDIAGKKANGDNYDYADVVINIIEHLRPEQRIYTSTVMPEGTYDVAKKLLIKLHDHWKSHGYYRDQGHLLHTVRFSKTDKNSGQINNLRKELQQMGLDQSFLDAQFGASELRVENVTVKKLGKYIKHPDRDLLSFDINTVACYDGILHQTDGFYAIGMEAVTSKSPFGQIVEKINMLHGRVEIPQYVKIQDFQASRTVHELLKGRVPELLPNIKLDVVDVDGTVIEVQELLSLRRDLLAYTYAYYLLNLTEESGINDTQRRAVVQYKEKLANRWKQTQTLMTQSDDDEAIYASKQWYDKIQMVLKKLGC